MPKPTLRSKLLETGDGDFMEVVRHSLWALFWLCITTVVQFAFDFLLTRKFGAHGSGVFYLSFSVLMALSLVGRLGLDQAVVRFIPPFLSKKPGAAAGVNRASVQLSLLMTLPLSVLLFVLAPTLAHDVFHSGELTTYLRIFAVVMPAFSLNYIYTGTLRALKRSQASLIVSRFGYYLLGIVGLLTLGSSYGIKGVVIGFSIAILLATIAAALFIRKHMPSYDKIVPFSKKRLLVTSLPLLFVIFATQMNGQASVLLLGAVTDNTAVGIFNIALKISMLMTLILAAINVIAATKISELYFANKPKELNIMISKISALGTFASLPALVLLVAFSGFWLGLFGSEFSAGSTTLILLAIGQFVNVSVGSTNYILAMTGRERALAYAIGISLVLNVILGLVLIPKYGVLGAGISTAATNAVSNIIMVFMVKYYLGVWPLPFKYAGIWLRKFAPAK